jgi:hypothetical protein
MLTSQLQQLLLSSHRYLWLLKILQGAGHNIDQHQGRRTPRCRVTGGLYPPFSRAVLTASGPSDSVTGSRSRQT